MWNTNERDGKVDQAKGKVKQAVGTLTGNDDLKAEGQADERVGKVEAAAGKLGRKVGKFVTRVAHGGQDGAQMTISRRVVNQIVVR